MEAPPAGGDPLFFLAFRLRQVHFTTFSRQVNLFGKNARSIFVISTEAGRSGTVEGGGEQRPRSDLDEDK